jgi:ATP-dependent Clp protease ATP-binding subunit ClpA
VIGQEEAIVAVSKSSAAPAPGSRTEAADRLVHLSRPSGVGRRARALAEFLFGDEDAMIRSTCRVHGEALLMSARRLASGLHRLRRGGQLTSVRRNVLGRPAGQVEGPPDVFNILLQILEDELTDAQGARSTSATRS